MKKILSSLTLLFSLTFSQDAIVVSPSTLDFGNVLMGNTPTQTFTLTCNLDQTITITSPSFYSVDITEIAMTDGQTQLVVVTFDPPQVGTFNSQVVLAGSTFGTAIVNVQATAVNNLEGSLSGTISADFSPYEISGDITIDEGNTLNIEPGVNLIFTGDYKFSIFGKINAVGKPSELIKFSSSQGIIWKGIEIFSDENLFQYCIIKGVGDSNTPPMINLNFSENYGAYTHYNEGSSEFTVLGISDENYYSYPSSFLLSLDYNNGNSSTNNRSYIEINEDIYVDGDSSKITFYLLKVAETNASNNSIRLQSKDLNSGSWETPGNNSELFISSSSHPDSWGETGAWYKYEIPLTNFKGQTKRFRLDIRKYSYVYNGRPEYPWFIDDISFSGIGRAAVRNISGSIEIINSAITNSSNAITSRSGSINIINSVLSQNESHALHNNSSQIFILNSIIHNNAVGMPNYQSLYNVSGIFSLSHSMVDFINSNGIFGDYNDMGGNIEGNPMFVGDYFNINPMYSDCVDSGHPNTNDSCIPPGLGSLASDIGMYGGMNNCGAQESNLGGGEPSITVVEDMPQDQGGYVGIQFSGSHYDGNSNVYDVTHYSVWRELETDGSSSIEAQPTPDGRYFRLNARNTNAWEYIGDTPAQEFDNYGYTAPTIADSNHIGMFTSNFLVVAHTDDDDVFFVSEPMSGYSVDNIAPSDPSNVSFQTFTYTTTLSWDTPVDEDYAYTEVRRNGEVLASGSTFNQFVDESLVPGESYNYEIVHVDVNGNISREVSRDASAPEWYFTFTTQADGGLSNSVFYFAGNDEASMGYDPGYDLPAPPLPPNPGVRIIYNNPSWGSETLSNHFSYISIDNVDQDYFYRYVDVEIHPDITDTIDIEVLPFGNYNDLAGLWIMVNNDSLVAIEFETTFSVPVVEQEITHLKLIAGNPEKSDGFIAVSGLDEISIFPGDTTVGLNVAFTSEVYDYDLVYSLSNTTEFPFIENIAYDTSGYDTLNIDLAELLFTIQASHVPNITLSVVGYNEDGLSIDFDRAAQATIIGDTVGITLSQPRWSLAHPYYSGDVIDDLISGDLNGAYVAYDWNYDNQAYELINNTDKTAQSGRSFWLGNESENEVIFFGGEHPDLYDENINTDGRMYIEYDAKPGWIMAGAGARPTFRDSIKVYLNEIGGESIQYSWQEAVVAGLVNNATMTPGFMGMYMPVIFTNIVQGFWLGVMTADYIGTHTIGFEFPRHFIQPVEGREVNDLAYDWGFTLNNLSFGFSELASNEYDVFDLVCPPNPPTNNVYMRIVHENWENVLGDNYLSDIRNSLGDDNIAEYDVKFVGTGDYEINTELYNFPDSLVSTLYIGDESYELTSNPLITISVVDGQTGTVSVSPAGTLSNDIDATIPQVFALHQNYPNPFNPTTQIRYDLPESEFVSIDIYDVMGRNIKSLVSINQEAGYRSISWNATNDLGQPVSAGMYIYTIQAGEFRQTRKMVLLK